MVDGRFRRRLSIRSALPEFVAFAAERRDDYHRVKFRRERAFAFTLAEIMIVVAVIALLAVLALPGFMRARKRAQAAQVKEDLRLIDAAPDQYAVETGKRSGTSVGKADWTAY